MKYNAHGHTASLLVISVYWYNCHMIFLIILANVYILRVMLGIIHGIWSNAEGLQME